jgi:hypothetical protein
MAVTDFSPLLQQKRTDHISDAADFKTWAIVEVMGFLNAKTAPQGCSVFWKLQDDSGGFQNFGGTLSSDGTSVQFKQTDPGGAQHGIMRKTSDTCSAADLRTKYHFTVSGSTTPMQPGDVPCLVSAKGTLDIAENGTFRIESDCSVQFGLTVPAEDGQGVEPSR